MMARATTPPITPPAMAPMFVPPSVLDCGVGGAGLPWPLGAGVLEEVEVEEEEEVVVEFGLTLVTWLLTIYWAAEVPQQVSLF